MMFVEVAAFALVVEGAVAALGVAEGAEEGALIVEVAVLVVEATALVEEAAALVVEAAALVVEVAALVVEVALLGLIAGFGEGAMLRFEVFEAVGLLTGMGPLFEAVAAVAPVEGTFFGVSFSFEAVVFGVISVFPSGSTTVAGDAAGSSHVETSVCSVAVGPSCSFGDSGSGVTSTRSSTGGVR